MDASALRRHMRVSVMEGALATSMGTLQSGVFLTGFALSLNASRLQIGILAALPPLAIIAQIAGSFWLERHGNRRRLCVVASALSRLLWLPVLLIPFLSRSYSTSTIVWWLLLVVAASSVLASMSGVAWLSWIRDLVPDSKRIGFLGLRNQVDTALALTLSIAGAAFVDWWQQAHHEAPTGYVMVLAISIACGMVGVVLLRTIPDESQTELRRTDFAKLLQAPFKDPNFRRLATFYASWSLSVNLASPFIAVFMLQKLGLPLWYVTVMYTIGSVAALATNRVWVRLSERFGIQPVVCIATFIDALFPFWFLFITESTQWALPLIFLSGTCNAALATGPTNLLFRIAPPRNASTYIAILNVCIGPVAGLAAIAGGYLAWSFGDAQFSTGVLVLDPLKGLFLVSFLGRLGSLLLLHGVQEPGARSATEMFRLLRAERSSFLVRFRQAPAETTLIAQTNSVGPIAAVATRVNELDHAA